jgi:hypothetical protein
MGSWNVEVSICKRLFLNCKCFAVVPAKLNIKYVPRLSKNLNRFNSPGGSSTLVTVNVFLTVMCGGTQ